MGSQESTSPAIRSELQTFPLALQELVELADRSQNEIAFLAIELARLLLKHEPELVHSCLRLLGSLRSSHPILPSLALRLLDLLEHRARTLDPSVEMLDSLLEQDQNGSEPFEWATEAGIEEEPSQIFGEAAEEDLWIQVWPPSKD